MGSFVSCSQSIKAYPKILLRYTGTSRVVTEQVLVVLWTLIDKVVVVVVVLEDGSGKYLHRGA